MSFTQRFTWLILLMLFFGVSLGACSGLKTKGATSEITNRGVWMRIHTDKTTYHPGEIVYIQAEIQNQTDQPVDYTLWKIDDPGIYVVLGTTPYAGEHLLTEKGLDGKLVNLPAANAVLEPQQSISRRVVWDQQLPTSPDHIQAPTGRYSIKCTFYVGMFSSLLRGFELSAQVEIQLEDVGEIILPEKALEIARNHPEVAKWYQEHGEPTHSISMVDNHWEVRFSSRVRLAPYQMIVKIESQTGQILSVEKGQ